MELALFVPYAYWLHERGKLTSTSSVKGTAPLYFFSPRHVERDEARRYERLQDLDNVDFTIKSLNKRRWSTPPFRDHFAGTEIPLNADKPVVVVNNKYCVEWDKGSVHYIPPKIMNELLEVLAPRFTVVYIRPGRDEQRGYNEDANAILQTREDYDTVRRNGRGVVFQDVLDKCSLDFNTLQFAICSRARHFIAVQGGNAVNACMFGGTCVIYAKTGVEVRNGSYKTWFPRLSGTEVEVVSDPRELVSLAAGF